MELKKIVINKRSGYIHTRDCESIKQMKEENKKILTVPTTKQLEEAIPCGHCLKKRDLRKIYTEEYERKKAAIEEKRQRAYREIDYKYDHKLEKIKIKYEERIRRLNDN